MTNITGEDKYIVPYICASFYPH